MNVKVKSVSIRQFLVLLIIRCLYCALTVIVLDGLWYSGSGGYHIYFNISKEVLALLVFIVQIYIYLSICIEGNFKKNFMNALLLLYFVPMNASFSINDLPYEYFVLTTIYFFLVLYALAINIKKENHSYRTTVNLLNNNTLNTVFFIVCVLFILYKISYNGFEFSLSMDGEWVYGNRAARVEYDSAIAGTMQAYLLVILEKLASYVAPVYLFSALRRRKFIPLLVSSLCILSQYAVSSSKTTLFFVVIVIGVLVCCEHFDMRRFEQIFQKAMLVLLGICCVEYIFSKTGPIFMYIVRRTMYLPAWINSMYYDFFSGNAKLHWSQSAIILQKFIPGKYDQSVLELISNNYFAGQAVSPNSGMFAEAFMQFGFWGCIVYGVLFLLLFNWVEKVYSNYEMGVGVIVALNAAIQIINVPMLRTDFVLSFGVFTFVLWFVPKICYKKSAPHLVC